MHGGLPWEVPVISVSLMWDVAQADWPDQLSLRNHNVSAVIHRVTCA